MKNRMIANIIKVIMCHFVGDYFMQTEYMAREKGKDWYVLFAHCVCYCVPFAMVYGCDLNIWLLLILHFVADVAKARYHKMSIWEDQIFHLLVAFLLYVL